MDMPQAVATLASLGQDTRLKAFKHLVRAGREGLRAGDLATKLGVPANTLSSHLRILLQGQLVKSERSGTMINYTANLNTLISLTNFLMEDCFEGDLEQCSEGFSRMIKFQSCQSPK
jgi:DNA-binding transcriptional ArsR family regulator